MKETKVINSMIVLLIILTGIVCWQGWLIKDCREQLAAQQQVVNKLVSVQSDTITAIHQLLEP